MAQNYRIYINDKTIIITQNGANSAKNANPLVKKGFDFNTIYHDVLNAEAHTFVVEAKDPKAFLKKISKSVPLIEAAGGLVKNKAGEYLFIYRNDKWDLPKGKLEKEETARQGAVREVEEECGIEIGRSGRKIINTYHAYLIKGIVVLKKSHWYKMKFRGKGKLKPQLEEGITEVRWFNKTDMSEILANTFPSIIEVMHETSLVKGSQAQLSE